MTTRDRRSFRERFFEKVDFTRSSIFWNGTRCHEWTGAIAANGYGQVHRDGKTVYAHRAAWELENGELQPGVHVLHHCDNRPCVNALHLFEGTRADNMTDMTAKGRQSAGSRRPHAKLTEFDVLEIRASNETQAQIARRYGIAQSLVSMIRSRRIWRHI